MKPILHPIEHRYQSTNFNCGQTALAMLLNFYGEDRSVEEIQAALPNYMNDKGEEWGSLSIDLADWCISLGFTVTFISCDPRITDFSWKDLSAKEMKERLVAAEGKTFIPSLGLAITKSYIQAFERFIDHGGELLVQPYPSSEYLSKVLEETPILASVCFNTLHGRGKTRNTGLREATLDDVNGFTATHAILLYGRNEAGDFLFADSWESPGLHTVSAEQLIAAISAAGRDCESVLFFLKR